MDYNAWSMEDEISLRDIYLVFKRASRTIAIVTVAAFIVVYGVSRLLPPTYESEALTQALVLSPQNEEQQGMADVFRSAPSGQALGLGFSRQIENEGPYVTKVIGEAPIKVKSRFDDKKNTLTIKVRGHGAAEVRQFAEELVAAFGRYVRDQVYASASSALEGTLEQDRLESGALRARIEQLKKSLGAVLPVSAGADAQLAIESDDVPPNVARSNNPALAYMNLELAKQETNLSALDAEINALQQLAANPDQLRRLSEQAARVNVLSPPPTPREPVAPRSLPNAAVAATLVFMMAVFWAFLNAALTAEEASLNEAPAPASPQGPSEAAATRQ
jgi:LPS O-antigen subunit length determinant protein (WzzB/FepE family)